MQPYVEKAVEASKPLADKAMEVTAPQRAKAGEVYKEYRGKFDEKVGAPAIEVSSCRRACHRHRRHRRSSRDRLRPCAEGHLVMGSGPGSKWWPL